MVHAVSSRNPSISTPSTEPAVKPAPGFDPAGQPLPDDAVWGLKIGKSGRALDTATGGGAQKIDGWERKQLLELATEKPQEFLQRLMADSANGTPVSYQFKKELEIGVVRIDFSADQGQFQTTASLDFFNNKVDGYLKPYLAQNARDKGARARVSLDVKGQLTKDGGLDDLQIEVRLSNAPKFSAKKLLKLDSLEKDIKKAITGEGSAKAKSEKVLGMVGEAMETLSEVPLPFLMKLIEDSDVIQAEIKAKGRDGRAKVETGEGKYSVLFRDFVGKPKTGEPDIRAKISGRAQDDTLSVDELRVFSNDKLAVSFGEDGSPVLSRLKKNGEREPVKDHIGEVMVYLPMALALAGGNF